MLENQRCFAHFISCVKCALKGNSKQKRTKNEAWETRGNLTAVMKNCRHENFIFLLHFVSVSLVEQKLELPAEEQHHSLSADTAAGWQGEMQALGHTTPLKSVFQNHCSFNQLSD